MKMFREFGCIELDEIERQVVQGRSHLGNHPPARMQISLGGALGIFSLFLPFAFATIL